MNWIRQHLNWKVAIGTALVAIGVAGGTALAADNGNGTGSAAGAPAGAMPPPPMIGFGMAGPGGGKGGDGKLRDRFASELANHLDGVNADEVSKALEQVAAEHEQERRTAMAKALSAQLDGVSEQDVSTALKKAEQKMHDAVESGKRPEPGTLAKTLAEELGISETDVTDAMRAAAQKAFADGGHADGRLPGPPPMAGGGPAPGGFAPPQSPGSGSSSGTGAGT